MNRERRERVRKLFQELCQDHNLKGWTLTFDSRPKRRFGCCRYRRMEIGMTTWHVDGSEWWKVEDTLRHEIAHAVVGPGYRHGPVWKAAARRLGAKPMACGKTSQAAPDHRWIGTCVTCTRTWKRHRLTQRSRDGICPSCFERWKFQRMTRWEQMEYTAQKSFPGKIEWVDVQQEGYAAAADSVKKEDTPTMSKGLPTNGTPADFTRAAILKGLSNEEIKPLLRANFPDYGAWKIAPSTYRRELRKKGKI